ncbi:MAG TPA: type II toxin-antitoxin system HipA family toxin [Solirubrobacteraceae bacterium]|nr:type II toxin-antitoxin system HipA family toxin [Solirubrobacteraceae bacterium]
MAEALAIWLNQLHVATVERDRKGRLRLYYTDSAHETFEGGTPVLSLNLPLTNERHPNARTRAFLDGLLPEGEPRRAIAEDLDVPASDVFGLLAELGRDCAGALVIQPAGDPPPSMPSTTAAEPLGDDELAELVANLRSAPLGVGRKVRLSLAGVQEKLLLTRMPDGRWGRPIDGTPSTHILKPEIERFVNTVQNEAFCMRIAHHLGLDVAHVETTTIDERPVLVVQRYDRGVASDGSVSRVHQEDFCQALGVDPDRKYQEDAGPSLAAIARVLQDVARNEDTQSFLRALTLNIAIGNCDAHAKNFSLLHTDPGALRLAPLYDLMSTRLYPVDDKLAMYVDTVQKADRVTAERIVNEAAAWGLRRQLAADVVGSVLAQIPEAAASAADETADVPDELLQLVQTRTKRLAADRLIGA